MGWDMGGYGGEGKGGVASLEGEAGSTRSQPKQRCKLRLVILLTKGRAANSLIMIGESEEEFPAWAKGLPLVSLLLGLLIVMALLDLYLAKAIKESLSFVLGVWGVIVTLVGLGFAIWQLKRSSSASKAAEDAVKRLRNDFSAIDFISEIYRCKQEIKFALAKLNSSDWHSAGLHIEPVRETIWRIVATSGRISGLNEDELRDDVSFLLTAQNTLESVSDNNFDCSDIRGGLRKISDSLIKIDIQLRDQFSER